MLAGNMYQNLTNVALCCAPLCRSQKEPRFSQGLQVRASGPGAGPAGCSGDGSAHHCGRVRDGGNRCLRLSIFHRTRPAKFISHGCICEKEKGREGGKKKSHLWHRVDTRCPQAPPTCHGCQPHSCCWVWWGADGSGGFFCFASKFHVTATSRPRRTQ